MEIRGRPLEFKFQFERHFQVCGVAFTYVCVSSFTCVSERERVSYEGICVRREMCVNQDLVCVCRKDLFSKMPRLFATSKHQPVVQQQVVSILDYSLEAQQLQNDIGSLVSNPDQKIEVSLDQLVSVLFVCSLRKKMNLSFLNFIRRAMTKSRATLK
jgi:hypothetical protein